MLLLVFHFLLWFSKVSFSTLELSLKNKIEYEHDLRCKYLTANHILGDQRQQLLPHVALPLPWSEYQF